MSQETQDEKARAIIEETRRKALEDELKKVNRRTYSDKELEELTGIHREIDARKKKILQLEQELHPLQEKFNTHLHNESITPLVAPVYFILALMAAVDILFICFFRDIFAQAPFLQWLWAILLAMIAIIIVIQIVIQKVNRKARIPLGERMNALKAEIASNEHAIKELETRRDSL